jgi:hypothetical protein
MMPLYKKVNQLVSQVYPDYSPKYNLMRGNVVRLTIGDYIYRMPGFLESVNVTIDNSNTPWEILLGEYAEDDVRQLPHMVNIQCSFKPIMDILPRKESYASPFVPLIANRDNYLNPNAINVADQQKILLPVANQVTVISQPTSDPVPASATQDTTTAAKFLAPLAPTTKVPFTPLFPATTTSAKNNSFLFLSNP